ncbi:hypothetical protein [Gordonia sp. NPDC058843]|jgi:hypothetical protein|uniref:hypothetical protein n=1 Tax=Gordonia sp. NPDC058843 TaxID=3346648 RepID=UPI00368F832D
MRKLIVRLGVAVTGAGIGLVMVTSPAAAASSARVSLATPAPNTVVSTIVSVKDSDQRCYVSFYGPAAHQSPRVRIMPYGTSAIRTTGLPAGRYSAYLNCGALQVSKQNLTVTGKSSGTPTSVLVAPERGSSLSSVVDIFGSS